MGSDMFLMRHARNQTIASVRLPCRKSLRAFKLGVTARAITEAAIKVTVNSNETVKLRINDFLKTSNSFIFDWTSVR